MPVQCSFSKISLKYHKNLTKKSTDLQQNVIEPSKVLQQVEFLKSVLVVWELAQRTTGHFGIPL